MSATSRTAQDEEPRCASCGHDGYCECTCCTPDSVAFADDTFAADYRALMESRALAEETFARIDASRRG